MNYLDKAGNYVGPGIGMVSVLFGRRIVDGETRGFRARNEPRLSLPSGKKIIKLLSPISMQLHK